MRSHRRVEFSVETVKSKKTTVVISWTIIILLLIFALIIFQNFATKRAELVDNQIQDSYIMGETANTGVFELNVTDISENQGPDRFIGFEVSIHNRSNHPQMLMKETFYLQRADGKVRNASLLAIADHLKPNETVKGTVLFNVPLDLNIEKYNLFFNPSEGRKVYFDTVRKRP
ncbi:putative membrane protein YeiB [Paenibacillus shirakamiensis]|uniref:Membrane protein YeiB n=1 Tax=Paenibacillus shirakamiensis TaxID=1265935 RepID=A0ABS4JL98_9BACL|nr:DUF4352 domain-containing protein [Paenibacillus shirakamiensis]MBP2002494.1 putative membrane protein YeiB [Paenibacillus shirakamiensis]